MGQTSDIHAWAAEAVQAMLKRVRRMCAGEYVRRISELGG